MSGRPSDSIGRSDDGRKTFSVSPILGQDGQPTSYLYTVLNGKTYDGIRRSLAESYNLRAGVFTIGAALATARMIPVEDRRAAVRLPEVC